MTDTPHCYSEYQPDLNPSTVKSKYTEDKKLIIQQRLPSKADGALKGHGTLCKVNNED